MAKTVLCVLTPAKGFWRRALAYLLLTLTFATRSWIGDENPLILFPAFIGVFLLCYQGPWYARLVSGLIFFSLFEPLCMMVDTLSFSNIEFFTQGPYNVLLQMVKAAVFLALWLFVRRIVSQSGVLFLSKKLWVLLGSLALAPFFSTLSFTIWNRRLYRFDYYPGTAMGIAYTVLPFACLSALALLVAMGVLSRHEELLQRQSLAEMREVYYKGLQREQAGVRILRHDMHNHIAAAVGLFDTGQPEAAHQYLQQLSLSAGLLGAKRYCQNEVANAVIASKAATMEEQCITADIGVHLPEGLALPDVELCALLGNALDNAIEAAQKATEKRITVRARADKGTLMLRVENTLAHPPKQKNGKLVTSKADGTRHGFGLAGMEEIARRYDGVCEIEYDETQFCLLISIPLEPVTPPAS